MDNVTNLEWRQLLALRLEINAVESALKGSGILTETQIKDIRTQALDTAVAWSSRESDDVLALLRVHSSPSATMLGPPRREGSDV
jgi:hypothetical protein